MANEAATVAAEEAPPSSSEPALPDPPQLPKADPAQRAMKEGAKTPVSAMDANKGELSWACSLEVVEDMLLRRSTYADTEREFTILTIHIHAKYMRVHTYIL